jgi:NADPH:quinone reductase-like Zn-dependent oxidoreductase
MAVPPSTFRSWQFTSTRGGLEKNLKLNPSTSLPTAKPNQHLVQVLATSLNPVDFKLAENQILVHFIPKPATPGIDFAGRIVTPAAGSPLKSGQLIFGSASLSPSAGGALSEFALVPQEGCVVMPDGLDPADACTAVIAGITAYQTIVPRVKQGDKVFLNGGSGGVGVFGIQIAKVLGCHVTTTCSTANVELCKQLGADEVVDYRKSNVVDALVALGHKFDHVVDNIGTDLQLYWRCHEYTKPETIFISIAGAPTLRYLTDVIMVKTWPGFLGGGKRKQEGFLAQPAPADLEQLGAWMKEGKVKAVIDQKFPFEDAPKAFEKLKTGRAKGKIVVEIASAA